MKIDEQNALENPSMWASLGSDVIAFGGGTVATNAVLEYGTEWWMKDLETVQKKTVDELKNYGYALAGVKTLVGVLLMYLSSRYLHAGFAKKLGYGVSTGFFVSASTDVIEAVQRA